MYSMMIMGVRGGMSGTSATVPVFWTYTPVGLKPMRKKRLKMNRNERKRKTGREKGYFEEKSA